MLASDGMHFVVYFDQLVECSLHARHLDLHHLHGYFLLGLLFSLPVLLFCSSLFFSFFRRFMLISTFFIYFLVLLIKLNNHAILVSSIYSILLWLFMLLLSIFVISCWADNILWIFSWSWFCKVNEHFTVLAEHFGLAIRLLQIFDTFWFVVLWLMTFELIRKNIKVLSFQSQNLWFFLWILESCILWFVLGDSQPEKLNKCLPSIFHGHCIWNEFPLFAAVLCNQANELDLLIKWQVWGSTLSLHLVFFWEVFLQDGPNWFWKCLLFELFFVGIFR